MKNNSRAEGIKPLTRKNIIHDLCEWKEQGEIEGWEFFEYCLTYEAEDEFGSLFVRSVYPQDLEISASLSRRIRADEEVSKIVSVQLLSDFLYENADVNALMVLDNLVLVFDDPEKESHLRKELYDETGDEFFMEAGEGCLGYTWVERGTIIIDVYGILQAIKEDFEENGSFPQDHDLMEEFQLAFLSTLCHEMRHLVYECNEFPECVQLGTDQYPMEGGLEEEVEEWGNRQAENFLSDPTVTKRINDIFHNDALKALWADVRDKEEREERES